MNDIRTEVETLLQRLQHSALMGDSAAEAASLAMRGLKTILDAAPQPTGFGVWVSDAPDFASWRQVACFEWMPEGSVLAQMNEHSFDGSALWLGDDGNWFAHIGKRIVRRYQVLPAGTTPEQVTP